MRPAVAVLVAAPLSVAAGFYAASFAYRLVTELLFWVTTVGALALHLLGLGGPELMAPSWLFERVRANDVAMLVAGALGGFAALFLVGRGRRSALRHHPLRRAADPASRPRRGAFEGFVPAHRGGDHPSP